MARYEKAKSHEDALKLVCLICSEKAPRSLSRGNIETLCKLHAYWKNQRVLPSAVCDACRQKLKKEELLGEIETNISKLYRGTILFVYVSYARK